MKIIALISAALALHFSSFAQATPTVEKWEYLRVELPAGGFNSKTYSIVDDGSEVTKIFEPQQVVKDSTGRVTKFKTQVDAMNYFGNQGWEAIGFDNIATGLNVALVVLFKRRRG